MKTLKNSITLILLSLSFIIAGFQPAQDIPETISAAFKTGNSKELVKHFNSNVELVILENEDVYSKTQAEMILRDFFDKYPPKNFAILHQGGKNGSKYAIGDLTTSKGNFRVYFLLKKTEDSYLIHQLRIEKENE